MRSLLFVPGDDPKKIAKGLAGEADALILDLEDSVALDRKDEARVLVADTLAAKPTKPVYVRVNAFDTGRVQEDLKVVTSAGANRFVLPKCSGPKAVARFGALLEDRRATFIAIASETPAATLALTQRGWAHPSLEGLMWGAEDLAAELGASRNRVEGRPTQPFLQARNLCLLAAKSAGVLAIDTVYADFRDEEGCLTEAVEASADGFDAKAAIHPAQLDPIHQAFTPSATSIAWAKAVVAVTEDKGQGVASLNGQMIDQPHVKQARRLLSKAGL